MTREAIINALQRLGIKHEVKENKKGWLGVICPFHFDKDFGNAFINVQTGHFKCFHGACNKKSHIVWIVKQKLNCSTKQAYKFLGNEYSLEYESNVNNRNEKLVRRKKIHKTENFEERKIEKNREYHLQLSPLNPYQYRYTLERGFTKEFVEFFGIQKCNKGSYCTINYSDGTSYSFEVPFVDYFIVPLSKECEKFEARRLKEYEVLYSIYKKELPLEKLREMFEQELKDRDICYKGYKLYEKGEIIENPDFVYLLQSKNYYSSGSNIKNTIFNIQNLDYNKMLVVCEGIPGTAKIWTNWTKNVTALFGAAITNEQIEILKRFKEEIVVIPDNDHASDVLIYTLNRHLENVTVLPTKKDDTDIHYIKDFSLPRIPAASYLSGKYGIKTLLFSEV
jgi:hypothetical protein